MKTRTLPAAALAIAIVAIVAMLPTGCATSNSGGTRTLKQTEMDVSWPMTRFRNAIAGGMVTPAEQDQVNQAYASFHTAYQEALQTAHNNRNAPTPDNLKVLANGVISAIGAIPF